MKRRSFLIASIIGHVVVILLSILLGYLYHDDWQPPEPVAVSLVPPNRGAKKPGPRTTKKVKKEEEKKPEIITREKPVRREETKVNLNLDPDEFEKKMKNRDVRNEKLTDVDRSQPGGDPGDGTPRSSYEAMIQQLVRGNWNQPSRASLGGDRVPVVLVAIQVDRRGNILSKRITKSPGIARLNSSVMDAIDASDPLPEFYEYMGLKPREFELRFIVRD